MRLTALVLPAALTVVLAGSALAQSPTSASLSFRTYNDIPGANGQICASGDSVVIEENGVSAPTGWANRSDFKISQDGVTPQSFGNLDYFSLSADLVLDASPNAPRKEAGFRIDHPATGDALFIVNSDAGEIVTFGSVFQFYNFRANGLSDYETGTPISMGLEYTTQGGKNGFIFSATYKGTSVISPFLESTNLEQGLMDGSKVGGYFQIVNDPNNPANSGGATFSNIRFNGQPIAATGCIPEPGSLTLLGAGVIGLLGMRRRK